MKTKKGYFISLEGVEGVGKSTAFDFMRNYLISQGMDLTVTREPGGTEIAESIRQVLLHKHQEKMATDTEVLLMFASRAQNIEAVIKPALEQNQWVLADRFADASFAYQGGGRKVPLSRMQLMADWVLGSLQPDMTILLDAPVELGLQRVEARGQKDRIETEGVDFFERVRAVYLELAKQQPNRFRIVDATRTIVEVEQQLQQLLDPLIAEYQL